MNDFPTSRTLVLAQAAQVLESDGLQVLDRDWVSAQHTLDLVATSRQGALVAVEVRVVDPDDLLTDAGEITLHRADEMRQAASAWKQTRGSSYREIRIDVVAFYPDGSGGSTAEHVEEAA
jgi:putative endonuclease